MQQHFHLTGCQSRDFDAQIAHVSVALIAYNMFSAAKRLTSYETMDELFREVASQMAELTLSERIWMVIAELLQFVADLIDTDFASLIQRLMQKGDQQSNVMHIENFSIAGALKLDLRNLSNLIGNKTLVLLVLQLVFLNCSLHPTSF